MPEEPKIGRKKSLRQPDEKSTFHLDHTRSLKSEVREKLFSKLTVKKGGEKMTKVLMVVLVAIMMTGSVSAQETPCPCDEKQEVKVVKGARGPAGPAGPQGLPGIPAQIPEWYLWIGVSGLFFGLLGTGLAVGALVARPTHPAVHPVNVINIPGPGGNQNHH